MTIVLIKPEELVPLVPLTLILGGIRSGKSAFAEAMVAAHAARVGQPPFYIATAESYDNEIAERIRYHQSRRGSSWCTIEVPLVVSSTLAELPAGAPILLDCLTLWLSNLMLAEKRSNAVSVKSGVAGLLAGLGRAPGPVVIVSGDVSGGIIAGNAIARAFQDHAGLLNQQIANAAERVVLMTAGLPLMLKAL